MENFSEAIKNSFIKTAKSIVFNIFNAAVISIALMIVVAFVMICAQMIMSGDTNGSVSLPPVPFFMFSFIMVNGISFTLNLLEETNMRIDIDLRRPENKISLTKI